MNNIIYWENYSKIGFLVTINIIEDDLLEHKLTHIINLLYYALIGSNIHIKRSFYAYSIFISSENEISAKKIYDNMLFIVKTNDENIIHFEISDNFDISQIQRQINIVYKCIDTIAKKIKQI